MNRKVCAIIGGMLGAQPSWAAGAGEMRCMEPLVKVLAREFLTSPTVEAIAIVAMVVSAMVIAFEEGLPEWGKKLALVALAVSVAVGASSSLLNVFNVSAALI